MIEKDQVRKSNPCNKNTWKRLSLKQKQRKTGGSPAQWKRRHGARALREATVTPLPLLLMMKYSALLPCPGFSKNVKHR